MLIEKIKKDLENNDFLNDKIKERYLIILQYQEALDAIRNLHKGNKSHDKK